MQNSIKCFSCDPTLFCEIFEFKFRTKKFVKKYLKHFLRNTDKFFQGPLRTQKVTMVTKK